MSFVSGNLFCSCALCACRPATTADVADASIPFQVTPFMPCLSSHPSPPQCVGSCPRCSQKHPISLQHPGEQSRSCWKWYHTCPHLSALTFRCFIHCHLALFSRIYTSHLSSAMLSFNSACVACVFHGPCFSVLLLLCEFVSSSYLLKLVRLLFPYLVLPICGSTVLLSHLLFWFFVSSALARGSCHWSAPTKAVS